MLNSTTAEIRTAHRMLSRFVLNSASKDQEQSLLKCVELLSDGNFQRFHSRISRLDCSKKDKKRFIIEKEQRSKLT